MRRKFLIFSVMLVGCLFIFTGCVPGDGTYNSGNPAGFLSGIWHGWIAPISLILGLFDDNIRVYEPINKGWIYDFAFYISIIGGFGGISLLRNKKEN